MIDAGEKSFIIRMFHVHHNFGPKKALIDITLDIAKNEFVFVSGPSGAGKTSLFKLLHLGVKMLKFSKIWCYIGYPILELQKRCKKRKQ